MENYLVIAVGCILVNNIMLAQNLGACPYLGTSKSMDTAVGMSMAVVFVMVMASLATWMANTWLLVPFGLDYLRTLLFILIIASLVQFVEMFLRKAMPQLYASLGIFLPLITTNCAVMGVCLINVNEGYGFIKTLLVALFNAGGFGLSLVLFAGLRERIILARVPKVLEDTAIGLIAAGFISLAFLGFRGMG